MTDILEHSEKMSNFEEIYKVVDFGVRHIDKMRQNGEQIPKPLLASVIHHNRMLMQQVYKFDDDLNPPTADQDLKIRTWLKHIDPILGSFIMDKIPHERCQFCD